MGKPGGGGNLTLHGGPIQTAAKIYFVRWGSAWTSGGDPDNATSYLTNFYSHMTATDTSGTYSGKNWHSVDTQYYCCSPQTHITQNTTLAGSWQDTSSAPPSSPTQSQMAAEAVKAAAHFGDYSVNASYVIALPSGIHPSGFQTQWCAWHSSTSANGSTIAYTNLPYQPDAGASCGVNSVSGVNDGFSIVGGHEQMETETDPQPNSGWLDGSGSENGDKCAWVSLGMHNWGGTTYGVTAFPTQPIWSNAISGCSQVGYP